MHGFGRFVWPDGKTYEGCYEDDQKHGKGIFNWPNGKQYDGIGRSNKMHHSAPQWRKESLWEDGKQLNPRN